MLAQHHLFLKKQNKKYHNNRTRFNNTKLLILNRHNNSFKICQHKRCLKWLINYSNKECRCKWWEGMPKCYKCNSKPIDSFNKCQWCSPNTQLINKWWERVHIQFSNSIPSTFSKIRLNLTQPLSSPKYSNRSNKWTWVLMPLIFSQVIIKQMHIM